MLPIKLMRYLSGGILLILLGYAASPLSNARDVGETQKYKQLYVFGDSLSDPGNAYTLTTGLPGGPFPPSPPYFNGRFSNGPVWVEDLAARLNLKNVLPLPLIREQKSTSLEGFYFAVGGARTNAKNGLPFSTLYGFQQQIDAFVWLRKKGLRLHPQALFTVWIGANDYLAAITPASTNFKGLMENTSKKQLKWNRSELATRQSRGFSPIAINATDNISDGLEKLAQVGAKQILVANLPDLGKTPLGRSDASLSLVLSSFSRQHNLLLDRKIRQLRAQFPSVRFSVLDIYSLVNDAIKEPSKYGFKNVTESCLNLGVSPPTICSNANEYLFWDNFHPTQASHKIIEETAFQKLLH